MCPQYEIPGQKYPNFHKRQHVFHNRNGSAEWRILHGTLQCIGVVVLQGSQNIQCTLVVFDLMVEENTFLLRASSILPLVTQTPVVNSMESEI